MDFGVAQVVDLERMTVTGQILGSPAYMAPEVLDGKTLDFRSDVFSLGVMLYQMATGTLPFAGRNPHEVLKRIAEGRFADPRTVCSRVSKTIQRNSCVFLAVGAKRAPSRILCNSSRGTGLFLKFRTERRENTSSSTCSAEGS